MTVAEAPPPTSDKHAKRRKIDRRLYGKRHRRRTKTGSPQFVSHLLEMLESPAWRVLSLSAIRVLTRIEIELRHHGGNDNGKLIVTYDDFVEYGVDCHSIRPAIRELEALGFIEITVRGRAGNSEFRTPNRFRLTSDHLGGTHEWRQIKTIEEALAIQSAARKKQNSSVGKYTIASVANPPEKPQFHSGEHPTTAIVVKPPLLSISPGEGGRGRNGSATNPGQGHTSERDT